MRIERVDDKTVKCFLSNQELEDYDIDYKDFILRSDKAREIVQEIIEQAREEVGYQPPKFAFDLQIMMVPDQGLVLTFSDRDPEVKESDQFIECLREMKRILQRTRDRMEKGAAGQNEENGEQQESGGERQVCRKTPEGAPRFCRVCFLGNTENNGLCGHTSCQSDGGQQSV